jgi:hypothetical protein
MSEKLPPGPWTYHIGEDYTEFDDANEDHIFAVNWAMPAPLASMIAKSPEMLALLRDWESSGHGTSITYPNGARCSTLRRTTALLNSLATKEKKPCDGSPAD